MQVSQTGPDKCRRVGVNEEFIKFRSSPNFKNMKKFLKSKIEEKSYPSSPNALSPPLKDEMKEKGDLIQPPLPRDPPPPDSPPSLHNLVVKKEIEDDESTGEELNELNNPTEELISVFKTEENVEKPKSPVCRDFIRGTCKRDGTCKFSHELDLSQLAGVYTFCKNFQNSVCKHPHCKYVHATIFEEMRFYRTGVLPPHTISHHKKVNVAPPPQPPPTSGDFPNPLLTNFLNPPPAPPKSIEQSATPNMLSYVPGSNMQQLSTNTIDSSMGKKNLKKEWSDFEELNILQSDINGNGNLEKKCSNCEKLAFSVQFHEEKAKKMKMQSIELDKKIEDLKRKTNRIKTFLYFVAKGNPNGVNTNPTALLMKILQCNLERE